MERDESQDDQHDESSAANWLEDLGLDKKRYRSLEPAKIREYPFELRDLTVGPETFEDTLVQSWFFLVVHALLSLCNIL